MVRWIVGTSIELRILVVVVAALIMCFGVAQLRQMPVDVLPEFSPPYVEIQTESLGLSAEEVEQLITTPMEHDLLAGLPWLQSSHSESVPGLSSVRLTFQPGTDLMKARQMVSERLTQAVAMPHVSKPPVMLQPLSATNRVMIVGLSSKTVSHIQMSVLARWTIQPRLLGVPGVANVSIWGQRDRHLQVQVDPKRLEQNKVTLLEVLETTGNALWVSSLSFVEASTPGTGGFIDIPNQRLGIRHISPIVSQEELAQIPIEDKKLRLSDVASVVENNQPLIGDAITGEGPGLLMVIEKFPNANTLEVTYGIEQALAEMAPGLPGITVDTSVYRPADYIEAAIRNVGSTALIGLILLAVALLVYFRNARAALIALIAISLSLIAAALTLYFAGATLNMLALTGFVAGSGVLVCNSVFEVDTVSRRLRESINTDKSSAARLILTASHEVRNAILYAATILLLAVAPIAFMGGATGAFFRPLAIAYSLAIAASLAVMLTVTPALSRLLLAGKQNPANSQSTNTESQVDYDQTLRSAESYHRVILAVLAAAVVGCIGLILFASNSLLPNFKELSLVIHLKAAPGTSQPEMTRVVGRMRDELRHVGGVRDVGAHVGRAILGDQVVDVNSADLWVNIAPTTDYAATAASIKRIVEGYPGLGYSVQTYLRKKSRDIIPEPEDNVVVRIYGDRYDVLERTAGNVQSAIKGIAGIHELKVKLPQHEPALETEVDLAKAQQHGLKPGDVRRAAACLVSGIPVGSLYEDQKVFDVVVWSTPENRHDIDTIRNLMIDAPSGARVRLGDIADVRIAPSASVIRHDAVKRYVDVVADVQNRDLTKVAADINQKLAGLKFPLEYHARVLGDYAIPNEARNHLILLSAIAAIGIYFVLQSAFGNWSLSTAVFVTLPAGLVGGALAGLIFTGPTLSLGAFAGLLAVFGVTACTNILQIHRYQSSGGSNGAASVLVPTIATAIALTPVLFIGDVPGLEIIRPMVTVALGSLITSALYSLFAIPVLFQLFGSSRNTELDDLDLVASTAQPQ
jgi:Cu/Ag efflux pump CusA